MKTRSVLYFFLIMLCGCNDDTLLSPRMPEIVVFGKACDTVFLNTDYQKPDAQVSELGRCSDDVKVTGLVNTAMPGTYLIDYDYTDNSGKRAATVTRTVVVVLGKKDSLKIAALAAMYRSLPIRKQWVSTSGPAQSIRMDPSSLTTVYLDHSVGNKSCSYKIEQAHNYSDSVVLTTSSLIGDTLCVWTFNSSDSENGSWRVFRPATKQRRQLGRFTAAENTTLHYE